MDEKRLFLNSRVQNQALKFKAIVFDSFSKQWLCFQDPLYYYEIFNPREITETLDEVERHVQNGRYAVGFLSYEAAPAFENACLVKSSSQFPLCLFAVFKSYKIIDINHLSHGSFELGAMCRSISAENFGKDIKTIKKHIEHGDTYQVNYTHRLFYDFSGDPLGLFMSMANNQPNGYAAYLEWNDWAVCSASPELFFKLDGRQIVARPMKGTRPRGQFVNKDEAIKKELLQSEKDRAENVMIVDMIRNDLGRIADIGSVAVEKLYDIEKYPTVWQMTSTISAFTSATLSEILTALFPCASITGAPKIRTMQIINELETTPRHLYTGAIGLLKPDRKMQFNVAIRTALVNKRSNTVEYGVGSGIVWDSDAEEEWQECQVKSRILQEIPTFELLETMRYDPENGIFLLDYHLERLMASATYFDIPFHKQDILQRLNDIKTTNAQKIRLLINAKGGVRVECFALSDIPGRPVKLVLATEPISSDDVFLYHKTTHRKVHEQMRRNHPKADDVILWNERDELTETTIYNILLKIAGKLYTPLVECGLLAGTLRAWLLDRGEVEEKILTRNDLIHCDAIYVTNSVQGKRRALLLDRPLKNIN